MAPPLISLPLLVLLILCGILLHPTAASGDDLLMLDRFHRWMGAHGRSYSSVDEKLRWLELYRRNVEFIEATNKESWHLGYELGENEFTDLTTEEFEAQFTGGALPPKEEVDAIVDGIITTLAGDVNEGHRMSTFDLNASTSAPENFDWRDQGVVTPAKQQGVCGSCWTFATIATVESLNKINGGELLDLSEQELLDCNVANERGCKGGWVDNALRWIEAKGGAVTEDEYPYQGRQSLCKNIDSSTRVGKVTDVKKVRGEAELKLAVLERPVSVYINADGAILKNYKTGIYKGPCSITVNHAVVLIGYGVSENGDKYWILKNSWGRGGARKASSSCAGDAMAFQGYAASHFGVSTPPCRTITRHWPGLLCLKP